MSCSRALSGRARDWPYSFAHQILPLGCVREIRAEPDRQASKAHVKELGDVQLPDLGPPDRGRTLVAASRGGHTVRFNAHYAQSELNEWRMKWQSPPWYWKFFQTTCDPGVISVPCVLKNSGADTTSKSCGPTFPSIRTHRQRGSRWKRCSAAETSTFRQCELACRE